MAALTANRNTPQLGDLSQIDLLYVPMKASTKIFQGSLVCFDAGVAAPARTAVGLIVAGRAEILVDNSAGLVGALSITVRRGVFKWNNSTAGDLIAQANVGTDVYAVDDNTVALTNGTNTRSRAGKVLQVDSDGVWVETAVDIKGPTVANAAGVPTQAEFNALTNALRSLGIIS